MATNPSVAPSSAFPPPPHPTRRPQPGHLTPARISDPEAALLADIGRVPTPRVDWVPIHVPGADVRLLVVQEHDESWGAAIARAVAGFADRVAAQIGGGAC